MERRKTELASSLSKLVVECESLVDLLNTLLMRQRMEVENVLKLDSNIILNNPDRFLKASKNTYDAMQKVLAMNLDLETFVNAKDMGAVSELSSYPSYQSLIDTESLTLKLHSPEIFTSPPINMTSPSSPVAEAPAASEQFEYINSSELELNTILVAGGDAKDKTPPPSSSSSEIMPAPKPQSDIEKKLQDGKYLSRVDRYVANLPRPIMANLAFRRPESASEYVTASDSDSVSIGKKEDKQQQQQVQQQVGSKKTKKKKFKPFFKPDPVHSSNTSINSFVSDLNEHDIREGPLPKVDDLCLLSSVITPTEMYINLCNDDSTELDCISMQLNEICSHTKVIFSSKEQAKSYIKKYCATYYAKWKAWYRAEIINWLDSSASEVLVQLIDYGEFKYVSIAEIQVMPGMLCSIPKLAVKCHLACLYPPGSTESNIVKEWPSESLQLLLDALNVSNTIYRITFVQDERINDSVAIDFIKVDEADPDNSIGQQMIDRDLAVQIFIDAQTVIKNDFIKNQVKAAQGMQNIDEDMTECERLDQFCENLDVTEADTIGQALENYDAQDEVIRCPFTRPDGTCFKGVSCRLKHFKLRDDGFTTDKVESYIMSLHKLNMPEVDDTIRLFITNIINVHQFYAQLRSLNNVADFNFLVKSMSEPEVVATYKHLNVLPASGEIVAIRSEDKWYRALVINVNTSANTKDFTVEVFMVDTGDQIEVPMANIRKMKEVYMKLPFQVIKCQIHNIEPRVWDLDDEMLFTLEDKYIFTPCIAKVMYVGHDFMSVEAYDRKGNNIGAELINNGLAVPTENYWPISNEILVD